MDAAEDPLRSVPTVELLALGLEEAKALLRTEMKLARAEASRNLADVVRAGVLLGVAAALGVLAAASFLMGIVATAAHPAAVAAAMAAVLAASGVAAGIFGYRALPAPLRRTRRRLLGDADLIKEHVA